MPDSPGKLLYPHSRIRADAAALLGRSPSALLGVSSIRRARPRKLSAFVRVEGRTVLAQIISAWHTIYEIIQLGEINMRLRNVPGVRRRFACLSFGHGSEKFR